MRRFFNSDSILGSIVVLIASFFIYQTHIFAKDLFVMDGGVSAFSVPKYYLYSLVFIGVLLIINGSIKNNERSSKVKVIGIITMLLFSLLITYGMSNLGFLLIMPVGIFFCGIILSYKNKINLLVISIISSLLIWFFLSFIGNMPLPSINLR